MGLEGPKEAPSVTEQAVHAWMAQGKPNSDKLPPQGSPGQARKAVQAWGHPLSSSLELSLLGGPEV